MNLLDLHTPALIMDRDKLKKNIRSMALKAKKFGVNLRPHIKTHKTIEVGVLQKEQGSDGITVSTIEEAEFFTNHGFTDITYAVPLTQNRIESALKLSKECSLKVLVDSFGIIDKLGKQIESNDDEIEILVKVDCGYHRSGIDTAAVTSMKLIETIVDRDGLHFAGILTHAGHAYSAHSTKEILNIANQEQKVMIDFADKLKNHRNDLQPEVVSIGSTPTMMLSDKFADGITEIRPGNYVYFDYTQVALGSCLISDCALSVLSSVVGKYADRIVIDAGATALSKDVGPTHIEPDCGFGKFYADYESGTLDSASTITELSQEHGKVKLDKGSMLSNNSLEEKLRILPNHSCLTNNLFDEIYVVEDDKVVDKWKIHHGHRYSDHWNH